MNKVFVMSGVQWDQTYGEEKPLPTRPQFLSFKEGKKPMRLKRQQSLSGQQVLEEPEIKAFKAKEGFKGLKQS